MRVSATPAGLRQDLGGLESRTWLPLDLRGLEILTEAASGPFVVTPVIAALAGAKRVCAITRDSKFASASEVVGQTRALMSLTQLPDNSIEIIKDRNIRYFRNADIVTNLGFVRPIDESCINLMREDSVIPLMHEGWEFSQSDLDIEACRRKGIRVYGTNEEFKKVDVFNNCGWLSLKMLFESGIEIHKSKILVVSSDKIGVVIQNRLKENDVSSILIQDLRNTKNNAQGNFDAIVIADLSRQDLIIGRNGDIEIQDFVDTFPAVTVIRYAGKIECDALKSSGITVFPEHQTGSGRMALTLGDLGPRPVIELHAAGLKVGQWVKSNERDPVFKDLVQPIIE